MVSSAIALALASTLSLHATVPLALQHRSAARNGEPAGDTDPASEGSETDAPAQPEGDAPPSDEAEAENDENAENDPDASCSADADCTEGERCAEGVCTPAEPPQCISDDECSTGLVCQSGECMTAAAAPAASANESPGNDTAYTGDWALGGAIAGLAIGGAFYVMRGIAEGKEDPTTAQQISLTSSADLLYFASVPIMAVAGASARQHPQVRGIVGLRIAGWLTYGLGGLSFAAIDVLEDINTSRVNDGKSRNDDLETGAVWRGFAYALTAASLLTMGADTIISHVQGQRVASGVARRDRSARDARGLTLLPSLSVDLRSPSQRVVAAGLLGRF